MFREICVWALMIFLLSPTAGTALAQNRATSRAQQKPVTAAFMAEAESYEESSRVKKAVFKNGLTALIYESYAQPLVSIQTYVSGGFLDDPDDMTGIAELTARTRENIGEGSTAGAIRRRAQSLGGVFRGRAEPRYSRFEMTVPAARWKQALGVHAEAILTPFDGETLRLYADRQVENMRDEHAPPSVIAREELLALAFGEPHFARHGRLSKIAPEKIIEFHKNRYVPAAMTLVISGDVRAGDVLNEVVRVFNSKANSVKNDKADIPPAQAQTALRSAGEFRYRAMTSDIVFPKVLFGFPISGENSADYRALEVAAAILGIGETSVLNTRLRDMREIIFSARAGMEFIGGAGFFYVELETESQNIDMTEIAFIAEAEILKRESPSKAEMARAVAQLERLWWERRETVEELADALFMSELHGGWKRMDAYVAEIRKVTAADVTRALSRHITLSNCALMEYLPRSLKDRNLTAATARRTFENLLRPAVEEELKVRIGEIEPDFKIPPAGDSFRLNEVRHSFQPASILRGPEIYIREDHTSPLLEMGFYFTGGRTQEDKTNVGITGLMLEMMLRNGRENRQLEIYGGRLTPVVDNDYFGFFLSIPARNSSAGFERIKQVIKSPVFDKAELEKLKRLADARARASLEQDGERRFMHRLEEALFRGHVYADESFVTPASLKNISVETARGWYEENVHNVKPFAAIVGDTEGTSLAAWFVNELSGSRMKERKKAVSSPLPAVRTEIIENGGGLSEILIGVQAPSSGGMNVYETLALKDYLENRLRETEWATEKNQERETLYRRITCEYRPLLAGGSFIISAAAKLGDEARGAENLRGRITSIVSQPLHYADFLTARVLAAGSYLAGNQRRRVQIENLTKNLIAGRSLEEYRDFSLNIEQVKEEDLKELTRGILNMNKAITVVVRGGYR